MEIKLFYGKKKGKNSHFKTPFSTNRGRSKIKPFLCQSKDGLFFAGYLYHMSIFTLNLNPYGNNMLSYICKATNTICKTHK